MPETLKNDRIDRKTPYEPPTYTVLGSVAELTAGTLTPGSDNTIIGSVVSDRALKADFAEVDVHEVLAGATTLPLSTWRYKTDDLRVRHIGPMAQDFHAAFHVGDDERRIHAADAGGVALACIQALHTMLQERDTQISALWAELESLRDKLGLSAAQAT